MSIIEKSQEAIRKILGDKNKPEQYANYLKTGVSMSRILQSYQDRALRIAQAKYYQRQAKT